jgi:hypothetical protein
MRKIIFTLFTFSLAASANAQFQLSWYNAPGQHPGSSVIKTDMTHRVDLNGPGVPALDPVTGTVWDFTNAQFHSTIDYTAYDTSTSLVFIPAEYSGTVVYYLTPFLPYTTHPKFEIRSIGIYTYGEHIDRQAYSLGVFTGDNNDSLVILDQDIIYSGPVQNMPFPSGIAIAPWSSNISYNTAMSFTYTAQSYNQAPVTKVSHVTRTNEAAAAGKVKAMRLDSQVGASVDVLQIKSVTSIQDSFYVNGNPMPPNVLSQFGLSQGMVTMVYQYAFHRAGELTPMVAAFYDDAQFTSLHSLNLHRERIPLGLSVPEISRDGNMLIYPNPAASSVNISLADKTIKECQYVLTNVTGQVAINGQADMSNGSAQIDLTEMPAGMYYIRLSHNGVPVAQGPVVVTK